MAFRDRKSSPKKCLNLELTYIIHQNLAFYEVFNLFLCYLEQEDKNL